MTNLLNLPLAEVDPLIADAIDNEVARLANGLELIASENFVSEAVLEAAGCTPFEELGKIVRAWFAAKSDGGRHVRRVEKIRDIEQEELLHHAPA